jgi:hypothetical protein
VDIARSARKIVDLCGKVVNSDLKGVDLHISGLLSNGLEASGAIGIKDGVNQGGLSDSDLQGLWLTKHDLLAGFFFKTFLVPV